jgi:hypothetical protein
MSHYIIDTTKPFGLLVSKMVKNGLDLVNLATRLKNHADDVTTGGTALTSANTIYYDSFGLDAGDAGAGADLYALFTSIAAGSVTTTQINDFD